MPIYVLGLEMLETGYLELNNRAGTFGFVIGVRKELLYHVEIL